MLGVKIPLYAFAANPLYYADNLYLNGKLVTDLVIPDSVTSIGEGTFSGCGSIKSVTIGDSVISIGTGAFYDCTSLISVTIGDSVTNIDNYAFSCCGSLTSIAIPDSVTSIGFGAFYDTGYYNNEANWKNDVLYIGNHLIEARENLSGEYAIKTGTKTIADGAFYYCELLTSIAIPDSVIKIGSDTFLGCTSLTSITIPKSVTSIGEWAFEECESLEKAYYIGSQADKAKVNIEDGNEYLTGATWYYNSCIGSEEHTYDNDCDADCNRCGETRRAPHNYDVCNGCGYERPLDIAGDFNGDGLVNTTDLASLKLFLAGV